MGIEYQINIEYVEGKQQKHLSYRYDTAEQRDKVYHAICSELKNYRVDMNYLRSIGGVTVSTYNYSEPSRGEIAQIIPHTSFKLEVLSEILKMVVNNQR